MMIGTIGASEPRAGRLAWSVRLPAVLGVAHGLGDGAAGYLLGGLSQTMPLADVGLLVLLYNALAFGAQPFVGALTDRAGRPRGAAALGLALIGCALALGGLAAGGDMQVRLAVALAGIGGALFHVGGGSLALASSAGRAAGPGLFAAPGVVGLAAGGALAAMGVGAWWMFAPGLLAIAGLIAGLPAREAPAAGEASGRAAGDAGRSEAHFDTHDLIMIVLLAAIALRSAVWSSVDLLFQGRYEALIGLACAAALGKLLGGRLADWLGWRRYTLGALLLAAPLLALAGRNLALLLPGVALLQSATPAALAALARQLPRAPATAAGLALGLAIAIGGVPQVVGLAPLLAAPPALFGLCLLAGGAMWAALGPRREHARWRRRLSALQRGRL